MFPAFIKKNFPQLQESRRTKQLRSVMYEDRETCKSALAWLLLVQRCGDVKRQDCGAGNSLASCGEIILHTTPPTSLTSSDFFELLPPRPSRFLQFLRLTTPLRLIRCTQSVAREVAWFREQVLGVPQTNATYNETGSFFIVFLITVSVSMRSFQLKSPVIKFCS